MAGSLIKIQEEIVTSAVASVTLTGIDSTYDVYMVTFNNMTPDTDAVEVRTRFTVSGSPDSTANYDTARKQFNSDSAFSNVSLTNQQAINNATIGTGAGETIQGTYYLFNFNNASEYSFITVENVFRNHTGLSRGNAGGVVHTVTQVCDGIHFYFSSGNIASGKFRLFGLKK